MASSKFTSFSSFFIIFLLICLSPVFATEKIYIVHMGLHSHGRDLTDSDLQKVTDSHHELLASYLGSKEKAKEAIIHSYRRTINGFCAKLDEKVADEIRKHDDVISVHLSKQSKLLTTHAWEFLSLEQNNLVHPNSLWKKANFGEDIIIANIDTGVWPESQSFSDEGYGPIPPRWKGKCESGFDPTFVCNRKLIGANYFKDAFEATRGSKMNMSMYSPRDYVGHGTHTLSTAGGNFVNDVSILEDGRRNINGIVKGGAPRARVVAYKACWGNVGAGGCEGGDVLKAIDHAIYDGVDVLIMSIGSDNVDYLDDVVAIGTMYAAKHDILVVMACGNDGPKPASVVNIMPWVFTVGASTMDREFETYVELGNGLRLKGASYTRSMPQDQLYPIVGGASAKASNASIEEALGCALSALDFAKVKGKILLCTSEVSMQLAASLYAAVAGAVGCIIFNTEKTTYDPRGAYHLIPATRLNHNDGLVVLGYINSTPNPMGVIRLPIQQLNTKPAPVVSLISSRGPNNITPEILKPDIIAPGVDIIAAMSGAIGPTTTFPRRIDPRIFQYGMISGTSMAAPIVVGVVALLRAIYPNWSHAAIRSAIMTTASTIDNTGHLLSTSSLVEATPFDCGSGHIQPDRAADPGLIYDLNIKDYLNFLCVIGYNESIVQQFSHRPYKCPQKTEELSIINLNYPSITVPKLKGSVVVSRKVKNVGPPGIYVANVTEPQGISIFVEPKVLEFKTTGDQISFKLTLTAKEQNINSGFVFGSLQWSDGVHIVRSPITVGMI